jgi:5'-methylthioinosine phosphorylase
MNKLAIIGGSGLSNLEGLSITHQNCPLTPYGKPSAPLIFGTYAGKSVVFLARHGVQHTIPPHKINYRANLWSLKEAGVTDIIAVAAVGGIHATMQPTDIVIPHQLIDYTWSREHTFFAGEPNPVTHVDFTNPYCEPLRKRLLQTIQDVPFKIHDRGVYGVTQGPRLETAAEVERMERDGCDIVGMTGMPEAVLARELGICYATCAVVSNVAAGQDTDQITMTEIEANLVIGLEQVQQLLTDVIKKLLTDVIKTLT